MKFKSNVPLPNGLSQAGHVIPRKVYFDDGHHRQGGAGGICPEQPYCSRLITAALCTDPTLARQLEAYQVPRNDAHLRGITTPTARVPWWGDVPRLVEIQAVPPILQR